MNKRQRLLQLLFFVLQIIYLPNSFGETLPTTDTNAVIKITDYKICPGNLVFKASGNQPLSIENHLQQDIDIGNLFFIGDELTIARNISIQEASGCSTIKAGTRCTMIINATEDAKPTINPNGVQLLLNYTVADEETIRLTPLRLKIDYNKESPTKIMTSVLAGVSSWGAIKGAYSQQIVALIKPIFVTIIGNNYATELATKTTVGLLAGFSYAVDDKNLHYFDNEFDDNKAINKAIHYGTMHLSLNLYRCFAEGLAAGKIFLHSNGNTIKPSPFNSVVAVGAGILTSGGCLTLAVSSGLAATFGAPLINEALHANIAPLPATIGFFTSAAIRTTLRSALCIPNGGFNEIFQDTLSGASLDVISALSAPIGDAVYNYAECSYLSKP